jgi:CTP:molybdopterin cytidylyltransferase MocA
VSSPAAAGLILAAGAGTRFGNTPKLLAELNGRPLLQHVIAAMTAVPELEPVVVVLGDRAEQMRSKVDFGRSRPVVCPDWSQGLSRSLRCGAAALAGAERVLVALGDVPTLTPAVVRRFLDAPPGTRAAYAGKPGHPVVLGPEQLSQVTALTGDAGAGRLLTGGTMIECGDLTSGRDVDTPADLAALSVTPPA